MKAHIRPVHPELALLNANIITLDPENPRANWAIIGGGRIIHIGQKAYLNKNDFSRIRIIDCKGKTVIPGLIDAHLHLRALAESFVTLDLRRSSHSYSISDIQRKIVTLARDLPQGKWIRGYGYDEFYLSEKHHPTRWELDDAARNHPIRLTHRTGHAHVLNSLALNLCGITRETADPPGGIIERDLSSGEPTGLLYEMGDILSKRIPSLSTHEIELGISKASELLISMGVTTVHETSSYNGSAQWNLIRSWKDEERLLPRVRFFFGRKKWQEFLKANLASSTEDTEMSSAGVKIVLDETTGDLYPDQDELNQLVLEIHKAGFQAAIHAVEERAVESAAMAIAHDITKLPWKVHRHRIEHCSICTHSMARKLASYGATVVTQPPFIFYYGEKYLKSVPVPQLKNLYAVRTLMDAGVTVAGSSDSPIVPPNPFIGMYAAVSRMSREGKNVSPEQGIRVMDALKMHTVNAAYAGLEEHQKGSITPGKLADLVVLSGDPTSVPVQEIKELKPEMTFLGGKLVWKRDPS